LTNKIVDKKLSALFIQSFPMSFNQADQLMRGAPVKYVAGRTSPTTASFKKNFGRVNVPGMMDVMFNLRDWLVHKKSFHRPERPSPLEVLAVPSLGDYLLSFLPVGERAQVRQTAEMLLNQDVIIIPAFYVHTIPSANRYELYYNFGFYADIDCAYISVEPDGFARLEVPDRPDIWAHFMLPHAWSSLIFGQAYALMHELRSLKRSRASPEDTSPEDTSPDDVVGLNPAKQTKLSLN